jgi:hypothetical protein
LLEHAIAYLTLPPEYGASLARAATAPIEHRGQAIVAFHLAAWGDETTADILRSGILAAANDPAAMERLSVSYGRLLDVLASGLPEKERHFRAGLIASQFLGMAMLRYVWRVGPLVNLSDEEVSKLIAPVVQRFLTGPIFE